MNVKLFLIILLTVATLTSSSYSQDSTLTVQFFGFIQTDLKYCPVIGENEVSARRSRIGIKKQFNPFNFRIQYDFSTQKLMDSWFGYNLSKDIEIRVGRSFVFFPGDVIKTSSKIETIDHPAVGSLFYPRYNGIFVFGKYKSLNYNINLVNGTCFQPETDKNKDLMSMFWFENSIAKIELASYIGRLEKQEKNRYILGFELYLCSLDIETVILKGKDLGIESEGGYVRLTNHFSNSIDGLIEYDFLKRGYNKARYIVLGINKFIKPSVKIQFNYRKLFTEYGQEKWNDAIQIQLQFVY